MKYALLQQFLLGCVCLVAVGACSQNPAVVSAADSASHLGENFQGVVVVIDDPRTERRKQGFGVGYTARLSYQDDPILHRSAAKIAKDHGLSIVSQWPLRSLGVHCFVVQQPDPQQLAALSADPRVKWIQPFNDFAVQGDAATPQQDDLISVTQRFFAQVSERGDNVKVAVIDTGADMSHPNLRASKLNFQNFVSGPASANGPHEHHGTAVVGLIAARAASPQSGPAQKVVGLAHGANVHLLRACWQDRQTKGRCNTLTLALALDAAIDIQPDVLNLSLTGPYDRVLSELLTVLVDRGTLVVAAYDEARQQSERFPNPQPGVVYAFGIDQEARSDASHSEVLYAPRHAISLAPSAGFGLVSGHSVATPQIAAMAACLINRYPTAQRTEIVAHLRHWLNQRSTVPQAFVADERLPRRVEPKRQV